MEEVAIIIGAEDIDECWKGQSAKSALDLRFTCHHGTFMICPITHLVSSTISSLKAFIVLYDRIAHITGLPRKGTDSKTRKNLRRKSKMSYENEEKTFNRWGIRK